MSSTLRQMTLQISLDDAATFDNYFVSVQNRAAVEYLRTPSHDALAQFIYLWGPEGVGCSHLAQALCHQAESRGEGCFYLPVGQFPDLRPEVLEGLEAYPLVCLDDFERVVGNDAWERAVFTLFNSMKEAGARLLVCATCSPRELPVSLPDLHSRLQSGLVFPLQSLHDEEKRQALHMRATHRGIQLSEDVLNYVLQRNSRSMTALFGLLERLDQYSLQTQRRITVPLVRELMEAASLASE